MISLLVAIADNDVIGKTGSMLPWRQSSDLVHFKELTMGHPIIMGRKTYETINRPLPGRTNIVVTRDKEFSAIGCIVVHSLEDAIEEGRMAAGSSEIFVIGGANLFEQALPLADKLYLTRIHGNPEGDVYFRYESDQWRQANIEEHKADEKNDFDYDFVELVK